MDAIVIAGGVPQPGEPLYAMTQGRAKAMLDMGGQPMIERVLEGLRAARHIDEIIIVGLDDQVDRAQLGPLGAAAFLPDQGSMVANGMSGLRWLRRHKPDSHVVVGCSADIPHLEGHMVDALIEQCSPFDRLFYYPMVTRERLEAVYPAAKRTYTTFKGGVEVAGADIAVLQTAYLDTDHRLLERAVHARKAPLQIARLVGFSTVIKLLLKQLSLDEAAATTGRVLGADRPVGVVFPEHPELAMDADKPHQVEILRQRYEAAPSSG